MEVDVKKILRFPSFIC